MSCGECSYMASGKGDGLATEAELSEGRASMGALQCGLLSPCSLDTHVSMLERQVGVPPDTDVRHETEAELSNPEGT